MIPSSRPFRHAVTPFLFAACTSLTAAPEPQLRLNELEYLEMPGLNVMLAHDFYPEGHQGGVGIIQNGLRVATNGDLRLSPTPGQWDPVPAAGERVVDTAAGAISVRMSYPDPEKDRAGFNPVFYPDLDLAYTVRVVPEGRDFVVEVDLEKPLPGDWVGRVGFNMEFFPGHLFGKTFAMEGDARGIFPRQPVGPGRAGEQGQYALEPLAVGPVLHIAPESERQRMTIRSLTDAPLALLDGRAEHNNGWFVVRSLVPAGTTQGAIRWRVSPHAVPGFLAETVVQVSQVGYLPGQRKVAVVEMDREQRERPPVRLLRIDPESGAEREAASGGESWGRFLRYDYTTFDFSGVTEPGIYVVACGEARSNPFLIGGEVYDRYVWQPTLEYFLPVQMCHMRVCEGYRVWHGACHLDDARMAPVNHLHFDGYAQGPSTLTRFQPGEHVPGIDVGGWHDAGDYDLRVESQAGTSWGLALAWEEFRPGLDNTTVDQAQRIVEIRRPDGRPDILQQIEHGVLTTLGGYRALGRFYRGIIAPTARQYVHLGDASTMTDNAVYGGPAEAVFTKDPGEATVIPTGHDALPGPSMAPGAPDDRWVFTEDNPARAFDAAAGLAASARALHGYNDALADDCLTVAREVWAAGGGEPLERVPLAVELVLSTGEASCVDFLVKNAEAIAARIDPAQRPEDEPDIAWHIARVLGRLEAPAFRKPVLAALRKHAAEVARLSGLTPYGVPYTPRIWGAGWNIQEFGMQQYFLHKALPDTYSAEPMFAALNFVLGCHPGRNTASFVSGVGAHSLTTAYGVNRADWGHIPGGSGSGTALIRPDYPELLEWPYLWQQTEYVLGGGTTDYLFLALAAQSLRE